MELARGAEYDGADASRCRPSRCLSLPLAVACAAALAPARGGAQETLIGVPSELTTGNLVPGTWQPGDVHVHTDHSSDAGLAHQQYDTPESHDTFVDTQIGEAVRQGLVVRTDHRPPHLPPVLRPVALFGERDRDSRRGVGQRRARVGDGAARGARDVRLRSARHPAGHLGGARAGRGAVPGAPGGRLRELGGLLERAAGEDAHRDPRQLRDRRHRGVPQRRLHRAADAEHAPSRLLEAAASRAACTTRSRAPATITSGSSTTRAPPARSETRRPGCSRATSPSRASSTESAPDTPSCRRARRARR